VGFPISELQIRSTYIKTVPRTLQSQARGYAVSIYLAADVSVEDCDFDQVVGSKDHRQLVEFLLTCHIRLHPFQQDAFLFVYEHAATSDT
jgi:hypothetical protein